MKNISIDGLIRSIKIGLAYVATDEDIRIDWFDLLFSDPIIQLIGKLDDSSSGELALKILELCFNDDIGLYIEALELSFGEHAEPRTFNYGILVAAAWSFAYIALREIPDDEIDAASLMLANTLSQISTTKDFNKVICHIIEVLGVEKSFDALIGEEPSKVVKEIMEKVSTEQNGRSWEYLQNAKIGDLRVKIKEILEKINSDNKGRLIDQLKPLCTKLRKIDPDYKKWWEETAPYEMREDYPSDTEASAE